MHVTCQLLISYLTKWRLYKKMFVQQVETTKIVQNYINKNAKTFRVDTGLIEARTKEKQTLMISSTRTEHENECCAKSCPLVTG